MKKSKARRRRIQKGSVITWIFGALFISSQYLSAFAQKVWIPDYDRRDEWQHPEKVLDAARIGQGMVIADVGAGDGYFTFKLADRVGDAGKIYATDIEEKPLEILKEKIQQKGISNVITVLGTKEDPGLPPGEMDMIFMCHVFHIVIRYQDPLVFLRNVKRALKPEGTLVLVQWDAEKIGYDESDYRSKKSLLDVFDKSNFTLLRTETFLPRENIYFLRPK
jgi:ubiquinone/menaquinone biosynthesis C-methylase UbiE